MTRRPGAREPDVEPRRDAGEQDESEHDPDEAAGEQDADRPDAGEPAQVAAEPQTQPLSQIQGEAARADRGTRALLHEESVGATSAQGTTLGPPLNPRNPFLVGLWGALGLLAGFGIVLAVIRLSNVILWIVIAMFIALGLDPIVKWLTRRGLSRGWAVVATLVGVAMVCGLLAWVIVPPVVDQITQLADNAPGYLARIQHSHWLAQLNSRWHITGRVVNDLHNALNQRTLTSLAGGLVHVSTAFADAVEAIFTIVVLTIYLLAAMPAVKTAAYRLAPRSRRARVAHLGEEISHRIGGYILGQIVVAAINGGFTWIILTVLGLPYPVMLATLVGLLALVPIVGTLTSAVIITLVALAAAGWLDAAIVLGYYIAYHVFETYVLAPRIMRRAIEVPPVITIVAVIAGGALYGIVGALLAIPIAAGLLLLHDQVLIPRQQRS